MDQETIARVSRLERLTEQHEEQMRSSAEQQAEHGRRHEEYIRHNEERIRYNEERIRSNEEWLRDHEELIRQSKETDQKLAESISWLIKWMRHADERLDQLTGQQTHMTEQQAHTESRLGALINIVENDISERRKERNGRKDKQEE